ncbi:MAG: lmo0937 family membrane protein [Anaerolineales bacterium]
MLETIIVILLILWLLGAFGRVKLPVLSGNLVHTILVIVVILVIIRILQ